MKMSKNRAPAKLKSYNKRATTRERNGKLFGRTFGVQSLRKSLQFLWGSWPLVCEFLERIKRPVPEVLLSRLPYRKVDYTLMPVFCALVFQTRRQLFVALHGLGV